MSKDQQPICMCFVDFKKAFDSISHNKFWVTMMDMGYPLHSIDLLVKLRRKCLAKVKVAGTLSVWFRVKKGVRQGCVLSPYLFNILAAMVMRETLDGFQGGLQIGRLMNLHYADDIILLATSQAGEKTPAYLASDIQLIADTGHPQLPSAYERICVVPCTHNSFGNRSFSAAGPRVCNALPTYLRQDMNNRLRRILSVVFVCLRSSLTYLQWSILT